MVVENGSLYFCVEVGPFVSVPWSAANTPIELHRRRSFQVSCLTKQHSNAYQLFDKSPKPLNVLSTTRTQFTQFANNRQMGQRKATTFVHNNAICEEESVVSDTYNDVRGKQYVIRALYSCDLQLGRAYHALIVKMRLDFDQFDVTSPVNVYGKCGDMESAATWLHFSYLQKTFVLDILEFILSNYVAVLRTLIPFERVLRHQVCSLLMTSLRINAEFQETSDESLAAVAGMFSSKAKAKGVEWSLDNDASNAAVLVASEAHTITLAIEGLLGVVFTVATLTDEAMDTGELESPRCDFDPSVKYAGKMAVLCISMVDSLWLTILDALSLILSRSQGEAIVLEILKGYQAFTQERHKGTRVRKTCGLLGSFKLASRKTDSSVQEH